MYLDVCLMHESAKTKELLTKREERKKKKNKKENNCMFNRLILHRGRSGTHLSQQGMCWVRDGVQSPSACLELRAGQEHPRWIREKLNEKRCIKERERTAAEERR